jgi:hypothetical protein
MTAFQKSVSMADLLNMLDAILNRGIAFDDNVDCRRVSVTSHGTPGTEFSVLHTLGKVPLGYIVCGQNGAGSVYDGTTANTAMSLFLKSDVGGVVFRLIVF